MWQYLLKRLLLMALTLFGISVLCFLIVTMAPGDPAAMKAQALASGGQSNLDEQTLRKNQELYYLDRPTFVNFEPPTRTSTVRATLEELDDEENEARRKDALARLKGTIGTSALELLIPELGPRVADAEAREAKLREHLAALRSDGAAQARAALGEDYGRYEPQLPPGSDDAAWAEAWARREEPLQAAIEAPARRLLEVLAGIVAPRGPKLPEGVGLAEARDAWETWWSEHRAEYAPEHVQQVVKAWLQKGGVPETEEAAAADPELAALVQVGQLAAPALMEAMHDASSEAAERQAAFGLAAVAHKPWDLTVDAKERQAFAQEWETQRAARIRGWREAAEKQAKRAAEAAGKTYDPSQVSYPSEDAILAGFASQEDFVSDRVAETLARHRYRWDDWWYRAEEYYVDFDGGRQFTRGFAQTQFGRWFSRLIVFDLGESYKQKRPVSEIIWDAFKKTLQLNVIAIFLAYLFAIPLGVYSSVKRGTLGDQVSTLTLFLLYSVPSFWAGAMLILLFTGPPFLSIFPAHHLSDLNAETFTAWGWFTDRLWHLVLPVAALTYGQLAYISRQMRTGMLEVLGQDYIRTAKAKGLPQSVVIGKHALRNALIPILTLMGGILPMLFAGSVIIETIFTIDGLGKVFFDSILSRDYPLIMAILMISAFLTLLGILVSDIAYAVVDPRIEFR
ncbi:MAG: ABC transporter permease subunit [Planctomycetota bacterium]